MPKRKTIDNRLYKPIPDPLDSIKMSYKEYKELVIKLAELKTKYKTTYKEYSKIRSKYVDYLNQNPYKDEKAILEKEIEDLKEKILELIPIINGK